MQARSRRNFTIVVLVIIVITYLSGFGADFLGIKGIDKIRYGIDIKGGISTILYPDLPEGVSPTSDQLDSARTIIEKRLDLKSIFDRNITIEKEKGRILVEIPYRVDDTDFNPQTAIDEIGKTALLTFQEVDEELKDENGKYMQTGKIVIEGKHVEEVGTSVHQQSLQSLVTFKLNDEGTMLFAEATARMVGKKIAIFMDDELITAPTVNSVIPSGEGYIEGQRSPEEAKYLADTIRAGALPFKLIAKKTNSISPKLGTNALNVTVRAGLISFLLVGIFMVLYYRLPGIIADIALVGLVAMQLLIINAFGISVTLPGIAGIILSVGMGVDANIIIFERIKEELNQGRTLKASIDVGFKRAFTAILDANVTTLISGVILYIMGSGPIKGFAATLIIGVTLSFFTAIIASRIMLKSLSGFNFAKNKKLYGVKGAE